ncbi:MAG: YraN family protein, partial [Tardiphaga sp.]|nr:YraN family protein [Tardiphaga sp.]
MAKTDDAAPAKAAPKVKKAAAPERVAAFNTGLSAESR